MAWTAQLLKASDPVNGIVTLTYQYTHTDARTFTESVQVPSAQTDAWIQNRGAGRAVELDALDAFAAKAKAAQGPVVVTDHLATLPPPTAEEVALQAWINDVNEAHRIEVATTLGVSNATDAARLVELRARIKQNYKPEYQQYLR